MVNLRNFCCHLGIALLFELSGNNVHSVEEPPHEPAQKVEIRAVFIDCKEDEDMRLPESDTMRFQRQELLKHNSLRECKKKLALTVRLASDPNVVAAVMDESKSKNDDDPCDDYVPVDHIFEGSNKKRVRLLNPYILRLRRFAPVQAYRLKKLHNVSAVLSNSKKEAEEGFDTKVLPEDGWPQEQSSDDAEVILDGDDSVPSYSVLDRGAGMSDQTISFTTEPISKDSGDEKTDVSGNSNQSWIRLRRHREKNISENYFDHNSIEVNIDKDDEKLHNNGEPLDDADEREPHYNTTEKNRDTKKRSHNDNKHAPNETILNSQDKSDIKDFVLYEIGSPNLWYSVQVQLFEKLGTPEGKTVWSDLTNGEIANVSSLSPEWVGRDMTARYRPAEWLSRDDFSLPATSLYLLEPIDDTSDHHNEHIIVPMEDVVVIDKKEMDVKKDSNRSQSSETDTPTTGKMRPVRVEVRVSRALFRGKHEGFGVTEMNSEQFLTMPHQKPHRAQIELEVRADDNQLVRVGSSAAIATVVTDSTRQKRTVLTIQATNTGLASAKFRAIARDCGPELSNEINAKGSEGGIVTAAIVLPPQHTRTMTLVLPIEIPTHVVRCSLALVNEDLESVAVRDVAIKKDDRCFCVWHCYCVCLGEDPKLLCRDMSSTEQLAAGLVPQERLRHVRDACNTAKACCHGDSFFIELVTVIVDLIVVMLLLGCLKAIFGLICIDVSAWGLHKLCHMPRELERYHENELKDRKVIYDSEGWPVHPDTMTRSVQILSRPTQFVLNIIFFLALPFKLFIEAMKEICEFYRNWRKSFDIKKSFNELKNCFVTSHSSHDVQAPATERYQRRKQHGRLQRWMTPEAEQLSGNLWQSALTPTAAGPNNTEKWRTIPPAASPDDCYGPEKTSAMSRKIPAPHLTGNERYDFDIMENSKTKRTIMAELKAEGKDREADSDREDAAYVLTQMNKSRQSLAKSVKKAAASDY